MAADPSHGLGGSDGCDRWHPGNRSRRDVVPGTRGTAAVRLHPGCRLRRVVVPRSQLRPDGWRIYRAVTSNRPPAMMAVADFASGAPLLTSIVLSVAVPAAFLRPGVLDDDDARPSRRQRGEPGERNRCAPGPWSGGRHYWAMLYLAFVTALIAYSAISLTVPGGFEAPDAPLRNTLLTATILLLAIASFVHVPPLFTPISDSARRREVARLAAQVAFSGVLAGVGYASGWLAGLPAAVTAVGFALPMTNAHFDARKYGRLVNGGKAPVSTDGDSTGRSASDLRVSKQDQRSSRRRSRRRR